MKAKKIILGALSLLLLSGSAIHCVEKKLTIKEKLEKIEANAKIMKLKEDLRGLVAKGTAATANQKTDVQTRFNELKSKMDAASINYIQEQIDIISGKKKAPARPAKTQRSSIQIIKLDGLQKKVSTVNDKIAEKELITITEEAIDLYKKLESYKDSKEFEAIDGIMEKLNEIFEAKNLETKLMDLRKKHGIKLVEGEKEKEENLPEAEKKKGPGRPNVTIEETKKFDQYKNNLKNYLEEIKKPDFDSELMYIFLDIPTKERTIYNEILEKPENKTTERSNHFKKYLTEIENFEKEIKKTDNYKKYDKEKQNKKIENLTNEELLKKFENMCFMHKNTKDAGIASKIIELLKEYGEVIDKRDEDTINKIKEITKKYLQE